MAQARITQTNLFWHGLMIIAAIGLASALTRYFWLATTTGKDLVAGGVFIMLVAMMIFIIASSSIYSILIVAGHHYGNPGRLTLVIISFITIYTELYQPMRNAADFAKAEKRLRDLHRYESRLAASKIEMNRTPHAPAGVTPDMLNLEYHDKDITVTNLFSDHIEVSLRRVLQREHGWERCWLGIKVPHGFSAHARIDPGSSVTFINHNCDIRFDQAALEFQVSTWDIFNKKSNILFKSDSAFLPEYPQH